MGSQKGEVLRVRKAVIPVAGFATRFLPASRAVPKVMLPVLDTPAVHYVVEEARRAGIEHVVFVVSQHQEAVSAYFGRFTDLEIALQERGEAAALEQMLAIPKMAEISYVHQQEPLGSGHAILITRSVVGDEPFAVFFPDDLIFSEHPTMGKMIDIFRESQGIVIAVREVAPELIPALGIIDPGPARDDVVAIAGLVEKPTVAEAPSNLAIVGRYVLTPEIFDALENTTSGAGGEIQLTDAISKLLSTQMAYAYRFPGEHFDAGKPLGLLKASIYAALRRDDLADDLRGWLAGAV